MSQTTSLVLAARIFSCSSSSYQLLGGTWNALIQHRPRISPFILSLSNMLFQTTLNKLWPAVCSQPWPSYTDRRSLLSAFSVRRACFHFAWCLLVLCRAFAEGTCSGCLLWALYVSALLPTLCHSGFRLQVLSATRPMVKYRF